MKGNDDFSLEPDDYYDPTPHGSSGAPSGPSDPGPRRLPGPPSSPRSAANGGVEFVPEPARIDPWSLAEAVVKRWYWLMLAAISLAAVAVLGGMKLWKNSYTATAQLIRVDSPAIAEVFREHRTSMQTFADLLRTPALMQRVGAAVAPPVSADHLAAVVVITPERNKESLTIQVTEADPELAANLANLYAREAVEFSKELQSREVAGIHDHLQLQVADIDHQMRRFDRQLRESTNPLASTLTATRVPDPSAGQTVPDVIREASTETGASPGLSSLTGSLLVEQMRVAHQELATLLNHYTEANPLVRAQRLKLAQLESQYTNTLSPTPKPKPAPLLTVPTPVSTNYQVLTATAPAGSELEFTRSRLALLEAARLPLAARMRFLGDLISNPPGELQVLIPAAARTVFKHGREIKLAAIGAFAAMAGVLLAAALILLVEATSRRLKTEDDLQRVTHLPVIASLGDLRKMTGPRRDQWSFRVWNALQARLKTPGRPGMMCGIISSSNGEGRATWTQLLAKAASQRGHRVLTIRTQPEGKSNGYLTHESREEPESPTVTANILASPGDVAHRLVGDNPHMVVDISLPDWSWNVERRKQLEAALNHWSAIENVVILVTLPPASEPQAVLLAGELNNLVWLADSGRADAAITRSQIETLRHGRCQLIGAVLNHAPSHPLKSLFPRWVAA